MTILEQYSVLSTAADNILNSVLALEAVWQENKEAPLEYEFNQLRNSVFGTEKCRGIIEVLMKRIDEKNPRKQQSIKNTVDN